MTIFSVNVCYGSYISSKQRRWLHFRNTSRWFLDAPTIYVLEQNSETNLYPCKPQFCFIKVGSKFDGLVILMNQMKFFKGVYSGNCRSFSRLLNINIPLTEQKTVNNYAFYRNYFRLSDLFAAILTKKCHLPY